MDVKSDRLAGYFFARSLLRAMSSVYGWVFGESGMGIGCRSIGQSVACLLAYVKRVKRVKRERGKEPTTRIKIAVLGSDPMVVLVLFGIHREVVEVEV